MNLNVIELNRVNGEQLTRIAALEKELGEVKADRDANISALNAATAKVAELTGQLSQTQADLATARQTIGTLETANKTTTDKLAVVQADLEKATKTLSDPKGEVQRMASARVTEIQAACGIPPVSVEPKANPKTNLPANATLTERCLAARAAETIRNN